MLDINKNRVSEPNTEEYNIDLITWKTIISSSINKLYGLVGEARDFEIISYKGKNSILRIHVQDKDIFITSFFGYTFNLNKYISSENESLNAYIKVSSHGDCLESVSEINS